MLELMHLHIAALYIHDRQARLVAVNQWTGGIAPRFFLGRTAAGNLWRFRNDLPQNLIDALTGLCRDEPTFDGTQRMPRHRERYLELLSDHAAIEKEWAGPAYLLPDGGNLASGTVAITRRNADLLRGGFEDWLDDVSHRQPFLAVVEDGRAVLLCTSVRITDAAHEAGVETLPDFRRRGLAADAVIGWARAVRERGAMPLYSTSWENTASQRVAAKLGGELYGVNFHIT